MHDRFPGRTLPTYLDANGWTWAEYGSTDYGGKWNFGHIIPMSEWKVSELVHPRAVNSWTNLVPECAKDNDHKREIYGELERQAYSANLALAATLI